LNILSPLPCFVSFFFSSGRRHTRSYGDWSSDVCSSDLVLPEFGPRWPLGRTDDGGFTIAVPDRAQTLVFATTGLITAIVHNVGGRIDIERDADGTPTAITHSSGYRIAVRTDDGLITELRLPRPA